MKLSDHFYLEEFTITNVRGADNTPNSAILVNLQVTADYMEDVRKLLGNNPIIISSGYRSPGVNRLVGGAPKSAHMRGLAVDFICPKFGTPLDICHKIATSGLNFDQLIEEGTWVHLSFDETMRRQVLTKKGQTYVVGLPQKEKVT